KTDSLIAGGEFDSDAQSNRWTIDDAARRLIAIDEIEKVSGLGALRIGGDATARDVLINQTIRVVPGKQYEMSVWSRALNSQSASIELTNDQKQQISRTELGGDHEWKQ